MASGEVLCGSPQLRAAFARRLSDMYGGEVPAYPMLVEVAHEVNAEVLAREGSAAERLGDIDRVTAERHGAIRVGTATELAQVGRLFAAMGMHPVGCYDLRDAGPAPLPVVSTAFRPVDEGELAANPFRVFTSVLVPEDRRFFDADLGARVATFLAGRELFPPDLLDLADRAAAEVASRGRLRTVSSTSPRRPSHSRPTRSTAAGTPSWRGSPASRPTSLASARPTSTT